MKRIAYSPEHLRLIKRYGAELERRVKVGHLTAKEANVLLMAEIEVMVAQAKVRVLPIRP